jgi:gliding motility-associated-like protein
VQGSYEMDINFPDSVCLNSDFPLEIIHTGGEPTSYTQQWLKLNSLGMPVEISTDIMLRQPTTLGDMHFLAIGSSWLWTSAGETAGERIFDTVPFIVRGVDSIIARIEIVESVRIIGSRVDVLRHLDPIFDSVQLGEKLRITGAVDGRPTNYPHLIFGWDAVEFSDSEFAGFSPEPTNTDHIAFTGLIFSPQMFYFMAEDTSAYGCFSLDSVQVGIRQLTGTPKDDFAKVPQAFTPHNQDGINDVFMQNVDEITILNRWGAVIFEATGAKARAGWDGRNPKTGRMVDRGDYFFIITIYENNDNTKKHTKTGVVTVL